MSFDGMRLPVLVGDDVHVVEVGLDAPHHLRLLEHPLRVRHRRRLLPHPVPSKAVYNQDVMFP